MKKLIKDFKYSYNNDENVRGLTLAFLQISIGLILGVGSLIFLANVLLYFGSKQ